MSDEKRRCKINSTGEKGNFIKYSSIECFDEGNHPYTAEKAIVELDNGKVVTVNPAAISFQPAN